MTSSTSVPAETADVNLGPAALAAWLDEQEQREREAEDLAIIEAWKLREPPQPPTAVEQAAFEREEMRADRYEARLATDPALRAEVRERGRRLDGIAREARKRRPVRVGRRQPQGVA